MAGSARRSWYHNKKVLTFDDRYALKSVSTQRPNRNRQSTLSVAFSTALGSSFVYNGFFFQLCVEFCL